MRDADRVLDLLNQHPWEVTIPKLEAHALNKSRRLFWRSIYGGHLPGGKEVVDLVQQSIEKVLYDQRKWDPDANPDLFIYLKGIVDSDINHLADSEDNKLTRSETKLVSGADCEGDETEISFFDLKPSDLPSPVEILLQEEEEDLAYKFFWGFHESLSDKPRLQKIVECILDDVDKPADIAQKLGEHVNDIYNARKQLQRRLEEYRNKK
ncbi:MAG: hypothetical protein PHD54_13105 [Desulfuromonadaceae bacterium]|nr:hypothetical protein [Desulfuromonadaceae bacterium]